MSNQAPIQPLKWREAFGKIRAPSHDEFPVEKGVISGLISGAALVVVAVLSLIGLAKGVDPPGLLFVVLIILLLIAYWAGGFSLFYAFAMVKLVIRTHKWRLHQFRPFCPHCGKFIPCDVKWTCGYCNEHNEQTASFSFLYQCVYCRGVPEAYRCHHCDKSIILVEGGDDKHCATLWVAPVPEEEMGIEALAQKAEVYGMQAKVVVSETELLKKQQAKEAIAKPKKELTPEEREKQKAEDRAKHMKRWKELLEIADAETHPDVKEEKKVEAAVYRDEHLSS